MSMRTWSCVRDLKVVNRPSVHALCSFTWGGWDCTDRSAREPFIRSIFWTKKLPKSVASRSGSPEGKDMSLASHSKALVPSPVTKDTWFQPFKLDVRTLGFFLPAESWLVNSNFPRASRMQGRSSAFSLAVSASWPTSSPGVPFVMRWNYRDPWPGPTAFRFWMAVYVAHGTG